jgi:TRAP-type C4-dicarboxylate transport system permease small subunit
MSFIILIVLFAVLGIGLGLLFNKFVIKDYPEKDRKFKYVITVIVFFLITVALFAVIYGKFQADAAVKKSFTELEQYIITNHSNFNFVKNGIDITAVQNDVSKINSTIADLNGILRPKAAELGVPNLVYNAVINYLSGELQKKLAVVSKTGQKLSNSFVDENNKLTVSSLINGLQTGVLKTIKNIVLVLVAIFAILLIIYVLVSLSTASKEKKRVAGNNAG